MMKKIIRHKKKIASAVVVLALLAGSLSVSAAQTGEIELNHPWMNQLDTGVYHISSDLNYSKGLVIKKDADVTLIIDRGVTVTATGQDAVYDEMVLFGTSYVTKSPATAGVTVPKGSTLTLKGEGTLIAKGGNGYDASNGLKGFGGGWAYGPLIGMKKATLWSGAGGDGGTGAASGGAGIGGDGSDGGSGGGGAGGSYETVEFESTRPSYSGRSGSDGDAGQTMGNVYVLDRIIVQATAGTSGKAGSAGPVNKGSSSDVGEYNYNLAYSHSAKLAGIKTPVFLGVGSGGSGGGGGAAGKSANIGGSGAGGGGGGGGSDGAWYLAPAGTVVTTGWEDSTGTNGNTSGAGGTGGIGGRAAENEVRPAAQGGTLGTGGEGGNLYLSSTAKVTTPIGGTKSGDGRAATVVPLCRINFKVLVDDQEGDEYATGRQIIVKDSENRPAELTEKDGVYYGYVPKGNDVYTIYVDGENTEKTITVNQDTLNEDLRYYTMSVDVKVDDTVVSDKSVGLVQNYLTKASLKYDADSQRYTGLVLQKGITAADTYEIWVDGVAFDTTVTATLNGRLGQANYYTTSTRVEVDGKNWADRSVSLYQNGELCYLAKYNAQEDVQAYQAVVPYMTSRSNVYDIYVNNESTGVKVASSAVPEERSAVVAYRRAKVRLTNGEENWTGQTVTIQKGTESVLMNYDEVAQAYQTILSTGDSETYQVYVNGKPTSGEICMTDADKRDITLAYMKATVSLTKDGEAWTKGATCVLMKDGVIKYTLANQGNGSYSLSGIEQDTYDLYVTGSNSDPDTGIKITADVPSATVAYYTVNFHKNVGTQTDVITAKQIIRESDFASPATSPYQSGYTFLTWAKDTKGSEEYDFGVEVKGTLDLYAKWVRPSVSIGDYVKCDRDGIVNGDGEYFRLPNLVIHGYPNTGNVMNTVVIYFHNATVDRLELPTGALRTDAIEKNGDGKITLRFYDEVDKANCAGPVSVATAQKILRNMVLKVVDPAADANVSVMVYGDTNLVSEREDTLGTNQTSNN